MIVCGTVATLCAQPATDNEFSEKALMEYIQKDHTRLQLSASQKEPYTDITLKYADQLKALKKSSGSREKKREEARKLKKAKDQEMVELLSKKQYESYLSIQKERWQKTKQRQ